MFTYIYNSPIGNIQLKGTETHITDISFVKESPNHTEENINWELGNNTSQQLNEYFARKRKQFDLDLQSHGTPFQQVVWKALQEIPFGETRTYGEIAASIGNPKAARAVGLANNKNPIPILIPCHRVIGANGQLTGYAGGLKRKEYLLTLESQK